MRQLPCQQLATTAVHVFCSQNRSHATHKVDFSYIRQNLIPRAQNCLETLAIIPFQFELKSSTEAMGVECLPSEPEPRAPPPVLHEMGHEDAHCNPCTEEMEVEGPEVPRLPSVT